MKSIISELVYDESFVSSIKDNELNKDILYSYLYAGKITMQEYLQLCR